MDAEARALLLTRRDEVRLVFAASCGAATAEAAADAIDYHADCEPWGWSGHAVVCRACDEIVLPTPDDVLEHGALAWSR